MSWGGGGGGLGCHHVSSMHKTRNINLNNTFYAIMLPDGQYRQQSFACAAEHNYSGCQLVGSCTRTGEWIWESYFQGMETRHSGSSYVGFEFVRGLSHPYDILMHVTWKCMHLVS